MSQIEISCIGSATIFTNTPDIFSGGNVDTVKFTFDNEWDNFETKTAVFYTDPKTTSVQLLDENNVATIPGEMLAKKGKLSIGVIGTNTNDEVKTSRILTYIVGKGAITNEMETTSCTPDIWLQLLTIVKHNQTVVDAMKLEVDESQMPNKANKDLSNVDVTSIQSKGVPRFSVGTYTGTGTYGKSNPNTLTFDFVPKVVIVTESNKYGNTINRIFWMSGMDRDGESNYFTLNDKTLSWYFKSSDPNGALYQCNIKDDEYFYFALG